MPSKKNHEFYELEVIFVADKICLLVGHSHLKKVKHELQSVLITRTLKTCKICSMQF